MIFPNNIRGQTVMELKLVASNHVNLMPRKKAPIPDIDIARGVSHDLCNVLCWMNGYLQELRELCGTNGKPLIEEIFQASSEIEQLAKQLNQVGRPQLEHPKRSVDMGELLSKQANFVGNLYPGIAFNINIDAACTVVGHEGKMKRVIQNLLVNACDALQQTGNIDSGAEIIDGTTVHCWVSDDGYGMSKAIQRRAFDRYFTTKGNKGTGIGLANVKQIVEEHNGKVTLTSAPDEGTTVDIYLPLKAVNVFLNGATIY